MLVAEPQRKLISWSSQHDVAQTGHGLKLRHRHTTLWLNAIMPDLVWIQPKKLSWIPFSGVRNFSENCSISHSSTVFCLFFSAVDSTSPSFEYWFGCRLAQQWWKLQRLKAFGSALCKTISKVQISSMLSYPTAMSTVSWLVVHSVNLLKDTSKRTRCHDW